MFLAILCGLVGMVKCLSDPFKAGMTSNEGIKRSLLNHRVVFLNTESVLVFLSPAAAWDSNAIEIWEGFSGSSHLNEWRPLSESNLIVAFLSGCSQHHESCLAVVEKTNFPSTKIFFFPEKRLCSNSTSQGGDLVGAKKLTFLVFIIELYIHPSTDVPKNTKNPDPPWRPSIQLLPRRRSKRGVILRTSCAVRCGPPGTVATAYLRIRRHLSRFQGNDFHPMPWNFLQVTTATRWCYHLDVFPNTESLENFRNNFTKFGGFLFHKKKVRHRFERFIYHI